MNAYFNFDVDVFRGKAILLPCDDPEWSNFTRYFTQNFERFGLKKLISTSYAPSSKPNVGAWKPTDLEVGSGRYDAAKSMDRGKIFILTEDANRDGRIDIDDLDLDYLEGDGDFRSDEVASFGTRRTSSSPIRRSRSFGSSSAGSWRPARTSSRSRTRTASPTRKSSR